jgi:hypothetical protein
MGMQRPKKITFGQMRSEGTRGLARGRNARGLDCFEPHSRGWTGGSVEALVGVEGAGVGASVWLRGAGGLSLTCELGPAPEALCACWVALDRLEPRARGVNGLAIGATSVRAA